MLKVSAPTLLRQRHLPMAALGASAVVSIIISYVISGGNDIYRLIVDFVSITLILALILATFRTVSAAVSTTLTPADDDPETNSNSGLIRNVSELETIATTISDVIRKYAEKSLSHGLFLDEINAKLAAHPDHATIRQVIDQIIRQNISMRDLIDSTSFKLKEQTSEIVALRNSLNIKEGEALTDELTGIGNRRYFTSRLQLEMNRCAIGAVPLSVILIDIDHFKSINDAYGHEAGDHVLQAFVRIIAASIKSRDTFARYGGEEFVILLPATELSTAHAVAERLRLKLAGKVWRFANQGSCAVAVTASFGVAEWSPGETAKSLISRADKSMYGAKAAGRNCVVSSVYNGNTALI